MPNSDTRQLNEYVNYLTSIGTEVERVFRTVNTHNRWAIQNKKSIKPQVVFLFNQFIYVTRKIYNLLDINRKTAITRVFYGIKNQTIVIFNKLDIDLVVPQILTCIVVPDTEEEQEEDMAAAIGNLTLSVLQPYDGNPDGLSAFIDQMNYVDAIKETHEAILIPLIKTRLSGEARTLITNEGTIADIRDTIRQNVSAPNAEFFEKRMSALYQNNKPATIYADDLEKLSNKLTRAYANDGMTLNKAQEYTIKEVKRNLVKNTNNKTVQLLLQTDAGTSTRDLLTNFIAHHKKRKINRL